VTRKQMLRLLLCNFNSNAKFFNTVPASHDVQKVFLPPSLYLACTVRLEVPSPLQGGIKVSNDVSLIYSISLSLSIGQSIVSDSSFPRLMKLCGVRGDHLSPSTLTASKNAHDVWSINPNMSRIIIHSYCLISIT
jgi:hypothetical protein